MLALTGARGYPGIGDEARRQAHDRRYAGMAAYAARLDRLGRRRPASVFRIWVDTWTRARAEDVIRPILLRQPRPRP